MIFIYNGSKFKQDKSKSSEDLIRRYKLNHLDESEKIDRELNKGNHIYCWVSPPEDEQDEQRLYWFKTEEEAKDSYWTSIEEI